MVIGKKRRDIVSDNGCIMKSQYGLTTRVFMVAWHGIRPLRFTAGAAGRWNHKNGGSLSIIYEGFLP